MLTSIQKTHDKNQPIIRPSRPVHKCAPNKVVGSVDLGHGRQHDDGDKHTSNNNERPDIVQDWQEAITKADNKASQPVEQLKRDKHHPRLPGYVGMIDQIHLYERIPQNGAC
jgi:hypothetical protein